MYLLNKENSNNDKKKMMDIFHFRHTKKKKMDSFDFRLTVFRAHNGEHCLQCLTTPSDMHVSKVEAKGKR